MILGGTVWKDSLQWTGKYTFKIVKKKGSRYGLNFWCASGKK